MTTKNEGGVLALYDAAATRILVPLLFVLMAGMMGWMSTVDERQYILQREAVTEAKLEAVERRVTSYMDVRLKDLDNKMQLVIRQLELMNTYKAAERQQ